MPDLTRRRLLKAATLLPLVAVCDGCTTRAMVRSQPGDVAAASFNVDTNRPGRVVSHVLAGLSYETLQVVGGKYFSTRNAELVRLFRELNPHGVLRIGGNSSDWTVWSAYRGSLAGYQPGRRGPIKPYVLRPEDLYELAGFLRATGWKLIFGVNLKIGLPDMGAQLAAAVQRSVGDALLAIQIGNEANNFETDYAAFITAWLPYAKALRTEGLPIGGPDTGANTDWVIAYAERYGKHNVLLSRHYYRGGEKHGSIRDLLSGDPGFYAQVDAIMRVADAKGLPFILSEANSYWSGGRDGVSNAFAAALWGADFMLALAQRGVTCIDFHGGTLAVDQASLGHTVHPHMGGDLTAQRDAVTAYYGPIAGDAALGFQPGPLYHGMQLAQRFAGARMLSGKLDADDVNLTAYAAQRDDAVLVALINKDVERDVTVSLHGLRGYAVDRCMRLTAPALDSRRGTVFSGAADGVHALCDRGGVLQLQVPRGSATWLSLRPST